MTRVAEIRAYLELMDPSMDLPTPFQIEQVLLAFRNAPISPSRETEHSVPSPEQQAWYDARNKISSPSPGVYQGLGAVIRERLLKLLDVYPTHGASCEYLTLPWRDRPHDADLCSCWRKGVVNLAREVGGMRG